MESLNFNNNEVISSRQIADVTGKRHSHVIRDIINLIDKGAIDLIIRTDPNLGSLNDEPVCVESNYKDKKGELRIE